jgi:hypothetical protein
MSCSTSRPPTGSRRRSSGRPPTPRGGRGGPTHGFPPRAFEAGSAGHASGARGHIDHAVEAFENADGLLAELQDSLLPVEVGDPEVRAGITETRALLSPLPNAARQLERTLGR